VANEGGYSAGSIFLQVVPSFQGFEAEARRVARGMEGVIEDGLDKGAEKGANKAKEHVKDALTGPEAKKAAKDGGKQAGDEFSGAFQTAMQKRINNALKNIGTEGGEQVAIIRRQLESLKDKRIGVDVDAQRALNTLGEVELRAKILSSLSPTVDVQVNANRAAAELAGIRKDIERIDGQRAKVTVDVDTDKAASKINAFNRLIGRTGGHAEDTANSFRAFNGVLLTTATIGPALIPILVALAGGMAALGPAAVAGVAGLTALGIGFSGLGNAIKALNEVQKNSAKDQQANTKRIQSASEGVIDAQKRVRRAQEDAAESAQDASRRVTRAQRDAAQANEDAARRVTDAQARAARAVEDSLQRQEDAERSLADAQRGATEAQNALREARALAQKDLDDIADRQRQNALDERQAVIDLFNATVEYNAIQADGGATNLEKEQASINLGQAKLRLEEIREEETRLADERKKGVNGSERVKDAEDAVKSAIEQQHEAQEALQEAVQATNEARIEGAKDVKDAIADQQRTEADGAEAVSDALRDQRRAAEDAAESITDAQTALARAQKDYADALFETNVIGSESARKLKEAMDALGPAGQRFALFIFGLKDEFYAIRNAVQAGLFPGLQAAIQTLVDTYLPDFTAFMGEIGRVLGDIAELTAQTLTNDTWKQFFGIFRDVSPDLIKNYSIVFLNLATVLAQLATIAAPFAVRFSEGLADLSAEAVKFMGSAEGQEMWTRFFETVERIGPQVMRFFEALIPAFLALVEALMPLGELILGALTGLLEWIATLDPKVLEAIVLGIVTLVVAFQAAAAATALLTAAAAALSTPLGIIVAVIVAVIGILVYLYTTNETARKIINAAMKAIADAAKWYFNEILIPYWRLLGQIVMAVANAISWAWTNLIKPAWDALASAASWLWREILNPIFTAFGALVSNVFGDIKWVWDNVLSPVLGTIAKIVWELWELAFKVAFEAISAGFSTLGSALKWTWEKVIFPVIKFLAGAVGIDISSGKELKTGLVAAFRAGIGLIGKIWDGLGELAKKPVKFVIETVFNNGLIKGFNFLAEKLGMDPVDPIPVPQFRDGGVHGIRPGYTPGRDTHLIAVGGGEAILRPEATRALGSEWVYAINKRAKTGGVRGAANFLGGFKDGGVAWPVTGASVGTPFGKRGPMWSSGYHTGTDFPARTGTPIHAVMGGRVSSAAWSSWGGNLMKIISQGIGEWFYAHQSGMIKRVGDQVNAGDQIGYVGATGNTTGPHLHLELRVGGRPVDPMRLLSGGAAQVEDKPGRIESIIGGLKDMAGWVKDAVSKPLDWLKSKVEGPLNQMKEQFGDTWLTKGLAKLPERFFGALVDRIKGLVGGSDDASSIPASDLQRMVASMAQSKYGWGGSQWDALNWLVNKESSWNPNAQNPTSSAYGLFQFLDGTWKGYGPKTSDPRLQAEYGLEYIKDRYGNPQAAKNFHEGHNWYSDGGIAPGGGSVPDNGTMMYDNGGMLPPGLTTVLNLTGKPEPVFTSDQFDRMRNSGMGGGFNYSPTFVGTDLTAEDVAGDILFAAKRVGRGGVYAGGRPS
jgi:hypothetical protein